MDHITETTTNYPFLRELYAAFNKRDIEAVLAVMQPDVQWANGMHGGYVFGRDHVRTYWTEQFKTFQPQLEPLHINTDDEGRHIISLRQIVRDLQGNVLLDTTVGHRFTLRDGLIARFDILDAKPFAPLDSNDTL